jgi:hypothetical protein
MPLVQIHSLQGKSTEFRRKEGEITYQSMMATINVPSKDNFQVITGHDKDKFV